MKKLIVYTCGLLLISFLQFSCTPEEAEKPAFDVTTNAVTFKKNEAVVFNFTGAPDFISFYSGEKGNRYHYKDRTFLTGTPQLSFSTFAQNNGTQENSLKILASTDFSGTMTAEAINAATWIDLTSKATLSAGTDNTPSGTINLSELQAGDKYVYFAFKKRDEKNATQKPRAWTIRSFNLDFLSEEENDSYSVATLANAGWRALDVLNPTYKWAISASALTIGGGNVNTPENEDWVISKAFKLNATKPDFAKPVKSIDTRVSSFEHTYTKPGAYKVTFIGSNVRVKNQETIRKEVNLTITD